MTPTPVPMPPDAPLRVGARARSDGASSASSPDSCSSFSNPVTSPAPRSSARLDNT
jgi:hypothetical protein